MHQATVSIPKSEAEGLGVDAMIVVEVRGRVVSVSDEDAMVHVAIEGEANLRPVDLNEAVKFAMRRVSNARDPVDFPTSQRELHAP